MAVIKKLIEDNGDLENLMLSYLVPGSDGSIISYPESLPALFIYDTDFETEYGIQDSHIWVYIKDFDNGCKGTCN
jgi:hypothetical protein